MGFARHELLNGQLRLLETLSDVDDRVGLTRLAAP